MKINRNPKPGKPEKMELKAMPMHVWLSRDVELVIEKGDRLLEVANVIVEEWGLALADARQLAGYWFAIGERQLTKKHTKGWSLHEVSASPSRRYAAS